MFTKLFFHDGWQWRWILITLAMAIGCAEPAGPVSESDSGDEQRSAPNSATATEALPSTPSRQAVGSTAENIIVSDGPITVENGQVTFDRPQVTEQVEREIYQALSHHRNLAREIESQSPGGTRGSQHSRQAYEFAVKSYMSQYQLTEATIASILKKGDDQGW